MISKELILISQEGEVLPQVSPHYLLSLHLCVRTKVACLEKTFLTTLLKTDTYTLCHCLPLYHALFYSLPTRSKLQEQRDFILIITGFPAPRGLLVHSRPSLMFVK